MKNNYFKTVRIKHIEIRHTKILADEYWIFDPAICNNDPKGIYKCNPSDFRSAQSVDIYIVDETGVRKQIAHLACIDYSKLIKAFNAGEDINLNYAYIDSFEWYGTNKLYEIDDQPYRSLASFRSAYSFWNAEDQTKNLITIMQLHIEKGDLDFRYSLFYKANFDFTNISINHGNLYLDNSKFIDSELSIINIKCSDSKYEKNVISLNYVFLNSGNIMFDFLVENTRLSFLLLSAENSDISIGIFEHQVGEICLTKSKVNKVDICYCELGNIDARESVINKLNLSNCTLNKNIILEFESIKELKIHNCIQNGVLKFSTKRLPVKLSFLNTINCGRIYLEDYTDLLPIITENITTSIESEQLLMLKENYRVCGNYSAEDDFYISYRRMQNKFSKSIFKKMVNYLLDVISGYGTKPYKVLCFIIMSILFFALIYSYVPVFEFSNTNSFFDYVYISAITYFTVGFGDILPQNTISKITSCIESFIGIASMSYFLVTLARKIIR